MTALQLLQLHNLPIFEQLQLEEALLRADDGNWCLLNWGCEPAIVLGLSGQLDKLVDLEKHAHNPIPLIRRFSGGGTVVVDQNTLFVTFLFNQELLGLPAYPETILGWSADFYRSLFAPHPFDLKAQDYTLAEKKCGGNAQYFRRGRYLHHTTFLWKWDSALMNLLLYPPKPPPYRRGRAHEEFLTPLSDYFATPEEWLERFKTQLRKKFQVVEGNLEVARKALQLPHRKATEKLALCRKVSDHCTANLNKLGGIASQRENLSL